MSAHEIPSSPTPAPRLRLTLPFAAGIHLLICTAIGLRGSYEGTLPQFLLGANELSQTHHIQSIFLPIGYPVLLGLAFIAGASHGVTGMHTAMVVENIAILFFLMLALRSLLKLVIAPDTATLAALLISLHPELLHNLTKVSDTNLTALLLVLSACTLAKLRRQHSWSNVAAAGAAVGAACLVRPNLGVLLFLLPFQLRKTSFSTMALRSVGAVLVTVFTYVAVTTAVHGSPFFPQNGAYNTYAGANSHTEQILYGVRNAEDSVPLALEDIGIHTTVDWFRQSDQPGIDDARDLKYIPVYQREFRKFVLEHPGQMALLDMEKFLNFFRPETNRYHFTDHQNIHTIPWLALKTLSALVVPWWLYLLWIQYRNRTGLVSTFVPAIAVLYILPFVFINSDPRFRMPLNMLLLADIVRMIWARRRNAGAAAIW